MTVAPQRSPVVIGFDSRPVHRRIGLIVLATDHTTEPDFVRMCNGTDVTVYVARITFSNPFSEQTLRAMHPRLTDAAGLILPGESLDAFAYSCTAASVLIGDDAVTAAIREAKPGVAVVTPISAALAGFEALGAETVSVLAPYTMTVSSALGRCFEERGVEVVKLTALGLDDDGDIARVTLDSLIGAAVDADDPAADALFLSCTALRAAQVVERIEDRIGKPVVTSNQAMCWAALRAAGCTTSVPGFGRLFTLGSEGSGGSNTARVDAG